MYAAAELVVPRSMPMILLMVPSAPAPGDEWKELSHPLPRNAIPERAKFLTQGPLAQRTFSCRSVRGKIILQFSLSGDTTLNTAARKALRPYQAHLIADVCRSEGHALVEQPTGSGKTMQIVTLVAMQLGKRFTHAVIAAPQQQIEHAFVHPDYRLVAFPACQGAAAPDIEVPDRLILGARSSKRINNPHTRRYGH
jgi:hypothetical protein